MGFPSTDQDGLTRKRWPSLEVISNAHGVCGGKNFQRSPLLASFSRGTCCLYRDNDCIDIGSFLAECPSCCSDPANRRHYHHCRGENDHSGKHTDPSYPARWIPVAKFTIKPAVVTKRQRDDGQQRHKHPASDVPILIGKEYETRGHFEVNEHPNKGDAYKSKGCEALQAATTSRTRERSNGKSQEVAPILIVHVFSPSRKLSGGPEDAQCKLDD